MCFDDSLHFHENIKNPNLMRFERAPFICGANSVRPALGFAPLAFLYDLRIQGGLAHQTNRREAAKAAKALGFRLSGWHRTQRPPSLKQRFFVSRGQP